MPVQSRLLRRRFLKGCSFAGAVVRLGLPPLETMFNSNGTAYAAEATRNALAQGLPHYHRLSGRDSGKLTQEAT